jgi:endonuclease/exonuclease/phosphatase family metal-dependent hydrolase
MKNKNRLILYNIQYSCGLDGSINSYFKFWRFFKAPQNNINKISDFLKKYNPDIIGLIEVDTGSIRTKNKNNSLVIQEKLKILNKIEKIKYGEKNILKLFHHTPFLKNQANSILSKYKFNLEEFLFFNHGTKRLLIKVEIPYPKPHILILVHLSLRKKIREKQIKELREIVKNIKKPLILLGDFNIFSGLEELNPLIELNLKIVNKELNTYPSSKPKKILDIIMVSKEILIINYKTININLSDHLPLLLDYSIDEKNKEIEIIK